MNYSYLAYGIQIQSDCSIAALEPRTTARPLFTLHLQTGREPDWSKKARSLPGRVRSLRPSENAADPAFVLTEHGDGACHDLFYSDGARFVLDSAAERIWAAVEPPLGAEDLALYFLGPVMGFLLRQRHVTCLHASAIELYGRAIVFAGNAGYGKSTTAAALALRGASVICEDIVPFQRAKDCWCAIPGYPRVCLWPDSAAQLFGSAELLPRLSPLWDKRYLPLDGVRAAFAAEEKPLGVIYLFGDRCSNTSAPRAEELSPKDALLQLVQNTYMNWLLDPQRRAVEFDELCNLLQQVTVRRLIPHSDPGKLDALCDCVLRDCGEILKT